MTFAHYFWDTMKARPAYSVYWANDVFLMGETTDQFYSNGFKMEMIKMGKVFVLDKEGKRAYPSTGVHPGFNLRREVFSAQIGQSIYTPTNTMTNEILEGDRPYGGWAFAGASYESLRLKHDSSFLLDVDIGCIGPCASAEKTQSWFHRYISDSPRPKGWGNQVQNEFGVALNLQYRPAVIRLWDHESFTDFRHADLAPTIRASMGNIFTNFGLGGMFRLGRMRSYFAGQGLKLGDGLKDTMGLDIDGPSMSRYLTEEWYFYVKMEGILVGYNALLEGGWFSGDDPHTVRPNRFLLNGEAGLALIFKQFSLVYSSAFGSYEFKGDEATVIRHVFGSLRLTVYLN